jgi:raffinose/stachyose/melibiose transport system substrate-binding protein
MRFRRIATSMVASAILFAACSSSPASSPTGSPASSPTGGPAASPGASGTSAAESNAPASAKATLAPAALDLWATNAGDIHSKAIQDSAARFNAANPGVNIKVTIVPAPYPDKLAVAMSGGNPPQIYAGFGGGTLKAQVEAGKVYALDQALPQYPNWFDRFFPGVMTNAIVGGKTYAIPMNGLQPVLLFYNKPLFAKYGLQPPQTWADLMTLVSTFKSNGIIPIAVAGVRPDAWTELMWLEYLVDRNGGPTPFNNAVAGTSKAWSDPAFLTAAQQIKQLVDAGAFGKNFSSVSYANGQSDALVYSNKAAMQLQGTWDYDIVKGAAPAFISSGSYGYTLFPSVPNGTGDPKDLAGNPANFYSISTNTTPQQLAAALAYLHDEVSSDQYAQDFIKIGYVPAVQGVGTNLKSQSSEPDLATFVYQASQAAPSFTLSWDQALSPKVADSLLNNLNDLFNGQITPQQFVDKMNATL